DLYGFHASKHLIFYKIISNEEVEIVRILHENMDLKNRVYERLS
ncbi:type II toxin-antitoxin system RelE/ParE family toxin, partial [Bacteroidales bacterium OttesenSCG-928-L19]|nr:type II toxin-antitoxin system RelE/ParE family toxin [Bacteroidales bacterium OttesenSCG-928-L19]